MIFGSPDMSEYKHYKMLYRTRFGNKEVKATVALAKDEASVRKQAEKDLLEVISVEEVAYPARDV